MQINIIIPTYNRKECLRILLSQLENQTIQENIQLITFVVNDGSLDGTSNMLNDEFPNVYHINGSGNWWYTRSMNEGFRYALNNFKPDFFLTMNDDTEVNPDYISNLLNSISKTNSNSIIGSISYTISKPHRIITSGSYFINRLFGISKHYIPIFSEIDADKINDKLLPTNFLPGRGMLIPAKVLKDLNQFDEKFKQYHSDTDFCLRASRKGIKVFISWDAHILVNEKKTSSSSSFIKTSFRSFIASFFISTSRNYLPSIIIFDWRHKLKIFLPINIILFIGIALKNFFLKKKLTC